MFDEMVHLWYADILAGMRWECEQLLIHEDLLNPLLRSAFLGYSFVLLDLFSHVEVNESIVGAML